jgi:hypothetical protein
LRELDLGEQRCAIWYPRDNQIDFMVAE